VQSIKTAERLGLLRIEVRAFFCAAPKERRLTRSTASRLLSKEFEHVSVAAARALFSSFLLDPARA